MKGFWLFFFIFLYSFSGYTSQYSFFIDSVIVECENDSSCEDVQRIFNSLERGYIDKKHFYTILKLYVSNEGVRRFDFNVVQESKKNILKIKLERKIKILDVSEPRFKGSNEVEYPTILPVKTDDYLDLQKINETKKLFKDIALDKGFPGAKISEVMRYKKRGVEVSFEIDLGTPTKVKEIVVTSQSDYLQKFSEKKLASYIEKPFDVQTLKTEIEQMRILFQQYGYYIVEFELKYKYIKNREVALYLTIKNSDRYTFYFDNLESGLTDTLKKLLQEELVASKREYSSENISMIIDDYYKALGYLDTKIESSKVTSLDNNNDSVYTFKIHIDKGKRSTLRKVKFKGNSHFPSIKLERLFYANATDQAQGNYYDKKYYDDYVELLRLKYIEKGFVSVFIDKPEITKNNEDSYDLVFKIREGVRTRIDQFNLQGLPQKEYREVEALLRNTEGQYFNPIAFKGDLKLVEAHLKSSGYYFAKISNMNTSNLVNYKADNSLVDIKISVDLGSKLYADNIIIIGNQKTKKSLILRELAFRTSDLITSESIEKSQTNLLSLGIFSSVSITPVTKNRERSDILIFLREKDFGAIELAPGVRSDIGMKVTALVNYTNLEGMNKRISSQVTVNRRFDQSQFDQERRDSESLIEYDLGINYSEDYIFNTDYDLSAFVNTARKRLYSYDVDIRRIGFTISDKFNDWFDWLIRYQVENFSQFNATDPDNHGRFQVGSITPGVNFDFRNRPVNPTSGAYFNVSVEFANPSFLSQNDDERVVNYYKAISRNRFYIPMAEKLTFAISAAFGYQENLAKSSSTTAETSIPSIKLFRLSGADILRGYADNEMNFNHELGSDNIDVEVNSRAYMAIMKFEPRYFLSDVMIFAPFYDVGRVFIGEFDEASLRSSFGLSFKFITPVGTLDLDYGIKTLRKRNASGNLESPGQLHVSIGFF